MRRRGKEWQGRAHCDPVLSYSQGVRTSRLYMVSHSEDKISVFEATMYAHAFLSLAEVGPAYSILRNIHGET